MDPWSTVANNSTKKFPSWEHTGSHIWHLSTCMLSYGNYEGSSWTSWQKNTPVRLKNISES